VNIIDAQTTLISEGPVRSIIVTRASLGTSEWNFTTVYLLYKDRIETLTRQVFVGVDMGVFSAVRVSTVGNITSWLEEATASLDGDNNEVFQETVQKVYTGYNNPYREWPGALLTVRAKRHYESEGEIIGRWFDLTAKNGSFGYGFIVHDARDAVRIEVDGGRSYGAGQVISSHFYQVSDLGWGAPVPPNMELCYHWTILPHEDADYTYTQAEAEKAYHPLVLAHRVLVPIYIRADGSVDPPTAHISSVDNITLLLD
jgi:hypothetical protein